MVFERKLWWVLLTAVVAFGLFVVVVSAGQFYNVTLRDKVCVVSTVYGGYDDPPALPVHVEDRDKVKFLLYTDRTVGKDLAWLSVTTPYWESDPQLATFKNSIGTNKNAATRNNMKAKYVKWFAWRLPETQDCRYILVVDANVLMNKMSQVYNLAVRLFQRHNPRKLLIQLHQWNSDVSVEVLGAKTQARYVRDRVENQWLSYSENYRFPYKKAPLYWVGLFLYDPTSLPVQNVFKCVYRQCELWTLEDQISLPFCIWRKKAEGIVQSQKDMCTKVICFILRSVHYNRSEQLLQNPAKLAPTGMPICNRLHNAMHKYGKE